MKSSDKTVEEILNTRYGNGPYVLKEVWIRLMVINKYYDNAYLYFMTYHHRFKTLNEVIVLNSMVKILCDRMSKGNPNEIL